MCVILILVWFSQPLKLLCLVWYFVGSRISFSKYSFSPYSLVSISVYLPNEIKSVTLWPMDIYLGHLINWKLQKSSSLIGQLIGHSTQLWLAVEKKRINKLSSISPCFDLDPQSLKVTHLTLPPLISSKNVSESFIYSLKILWFI